MFLRSLGPENKGVDDEHSIGDLIWQPFAIANKIVDCFTKTNMEKEKDKYIAKVLTQLDLLDTKITKPEVLYKKKDMYIPPQKRKKPRDMRVDK